jgi:hypothetical protein
MNYVHRRVKVWGYTEKHRAAKLLPTWHLIDFLSSLKLLNALTAFTHSCCFPQWRYLKPKEFIWIELVHGLNLNRRSVSGLEPETPVTPSPAFRTLPYLSTSSSLVGETQAEENQRSNFYLFRNRVSFCSHVFTSNNLENFNNQITAISESCSTLDWRIFFSPTLLNN